MTETRAPYIIPTWKLVARKYRAQAQELSITLDHTVSANADLFESLREELDAARARITRLEATNRELLAVADNTALIMANHRIGDLEAQLAQATTNGRHWQRRAAELRLRVDRLKAEIERLSGELHQIDPVTVNRLQSTEAGR